jgi:hypothetical protein
VGQETTTTFKITLKYAGPKKDFHKLMRSRRSTTVMESEVLDSNTVKTKPQSHYSDDQKLVRAFLKQACVAAKLAWAKAQKDVDAGQYNLKYGGSYNIEFSIALNGVNVYLKVVDRANPLLYEIKVFDREKPAREKVEQHVNFNFHGIGRHRQGRVIPNEITQISIADPLALDEFTNLISKWGHLYQETSK